MMLMLVAQGADLIELGVPFSDPMADGPVIQRASERALAHGVSLRQVLELVALFRQQDSETPVILMGYLNPVEVMGYASFATAAAKAGVDGVLLVDLPPEESDMLAAALKQQQIDMIYLIARPRPMSAWRLSVVLLAGLSIMFRLRGLPVPGA